MNSNSKPTFTLIAGINGAGKSTSYSEMSEIEKINLGPRINPDEFTLEFKSIVKGGKEASKRRKLYLSENITFHQETTLTGYTIIDAIDRAKSQGYILKLIYVGLDSPDTAVKRVKDRAANGGHDVPDQDVMRRYPKSIKNLSEQINKFDEIKLINNTEKFNTVFNATRGKITFISKNLPEWAKPAVEEYMTLHSDSLTLGNNVIKSENENRYAEP